MLKHLAIIMDGNGRWANARNLPRLAGHKKGAETARMVVESAGDLGIKHVTLYAFSAENWSRPKAEVMGLMELLGHYLSKEVGLLQKKGARLHVIGDRSRLDKRILKQIESAEEATANNTSLDLIIALSYGSRQELAHAARQLAEKVKRGEMEPDAINEESIASHLYTNKFPDPDLLIRTGGEERLSNFLLWQSAYTEFYFTETLWPDFGREELANAVANFHSRERRFGGAEDKYLGGAEDKVAAGGA